MRGYGNSVLRDELNKKALLQPLEARGLGGGSFEMTSGLIYQIRLSRVMSPMAFVEPVNVESLAHLLAGQEVHEYPDPFQNAVPVWMLPEYARLLPITYVR